MVIEDVGTTSYHVDDRLHKYWTKTSLDKIKKTNSDRVYIVDGMERSGKSTWAFQQAGVLDKKMFKDIPTFLSRVCFTPDEFLNAVRNTHNGVILFDEAFRGLSSRGAMSKINKSIIEALMEMGQNNNIVFIILPRIFLLDVYPAMLRSHGLFNIYLNKKSGRRSWRGYNQRDKNFIYQTGIRKGWSYSKKSRFKGKFTAKFPGGEEFEKAYLKKKSDALKGVGKESILDEFSDRRSNQRDFIIYGLVKEKGSQIAVVKWLESIGLPMAAPRVHEICDRVKRFIDWKKGEIKGIEL